MARQLVSEAAVGWTNTSGVGNVPAQTSHRHRSGIGAYSMHTIAFLQDLAVVMIIAGLVTIAFHRFKQPVVLGYILAGIIIGPHTPPFPLIHSEETIRTLSELGVILLMFSLGLEFNLSSLKAVGFAASIAAILEIVVMVWVGYELGTFFGWSSMDSLFLGAILSISSTTIIVKALGEMGLLKERFAQHIFGILVIEDILAIAMIALLSGIATTGSLVLADVTLSLGKLVAFLVTSSVVGLLAVPRLLGYVARFRSNEMLLITVLGLCFGLCLLVAKLGYSVALGAFLMGTTVAASKEKHRVEHLIEPVRDMFSAIFFVSIGLLINPRLLGEHWIPIVVISLAVILGKILACTFGSLVGGNDTRTSLRVGMGLAQIGEFSFIIATLGTSLAVTSDFLYPIAVAVSAITTLTTPYLIRSAEGVIARFERHAPSVLVRTLELYASWVGRLGQGTPTASAAALRGLAFQLVLHGALIGAIFSIAVFFSNHPPAWIASFQFSEAILNSALWLLALLGSLPLLVVSVNKLRSFGKVLSENKVTESVAGPQTAYIRSAIATLTPVLGGVLLALYILMLSSSLLPPAKVIFTMLLVVGLFIAVAHRSISAFHDRWQAELSQSLEAPSLPHAPSPTATAVLQESNMASVVLQSGNPAIGKRIRELQLRTLTGASIVGIERSHRILVNPEPDEELNSEDRILLLGTEDQLQRAKSALTPQG